VKTELKNVSQAVKEMVITIDKDAALQDYNEVLRQFKNYVVLPGFRKGKAPNNMIERNYGEHVVEKFYEDKLNVYYQQAIKDNDQHPISQGELTEVKWEKGTDLTATFMFEVMPEIKVENYQGLEVPFEEVVFNETMIDETIEDFRQKTATAESAETAEDGDIVTFQLKFIDENDTVTKEVFREIVLGDNLYAKSFNTKIKGAKVGDEIKTKLFTKTQASTDSDIDEDIKDREFLVVITEIKRTILPELNDDFAKDMEYDSLADLRAKIEVELKKKIEKDNIAQKEESIIAALVKANPFDVPPSMVKSFAEDMAKPYAKAYKMELEKIAAMYETLAEFKIKSHLILTELYKLKKIEVTDEDKEKQIAEYAAELNMEVDKYKEMYKKQIESEDFSYGIQEKKILELVEKESKFVPYPKEIKDNDQTKEN